MVFKKDLKKLSKDEPYRESISSKLGHLQQTMLVVEHVPALKTMELELGKLYKSMKEVLNGNGQKSVDVKNETPSHNF